jgi:hypothetical protein
MCVSVRKEHYVFRDILYSSFQQLCGKSDLVARKDEVFFSLIESVIYLICIVILFTYSIYHFINDIPCIGYSTYHTV